MDSTTPSPELGPSASASAIEAWLRIRVARQDGRPEHLVARDESFSRCGFDSLRLTALMVELSQALGQPVSPTLAYAYPTIASLAQALAGGRAQRLGTAASGGRTVQDEPVAVIGIGCRFPKAASPEAFWRMLNEGVDAISEVPSDRWDLPSFFHPDPSEAGKMHARHGGFIEGVDQFDPMFFGISPREAAQMDPQQRLMLEIAWEALEDAGLPAERLKGSSAGVFVGAWKSDYARLPMGVEGIVQHTATGQDLSIISARLSYLLGLNGPSLTVTTACSSSLVAIHLACQSLRSGECEVALAGGVNLILAPESTVEMCKFGGLSPDGRSKAFDASANGYVRGEGAGVVVLKPLSRALRDGDPIWCVIRGSAVNNDGASNGLTAPNPKAQEELLRRAYRQAGLEPQRVRYVECHGTGTALGDPIEASALGAVLSSGRPVEEPLLLGSVKTNIGHLEAASGIAGFIKVALSLQKGRIPPSLHFRQPNPLIAFSDLRMEVVTSPRPWPVGEGPAVAGISSFGFGGTNAHVVCEAVPHSPVQLLAFSAETAEGLRAKALELKAQAASGAPDVALAELCQSTLSRSGGHAHRLAVTARGLPELAERLGGFCSGEHPEVAVGQVPAEGRPRLIFAFSGQGSQWPEMARQFMREEPAFLTALQACDRALREEGKVPWSLLEVLAGGEGSRELERIDVLWPTLFGVEVALAAVWRSWGIQPDAVVGHSIGEVAAAHVAGVLSLGDAARVICALGRAAASQSGQGGMAFLEVSPQEAQQLVQRHEGRLWLAIYAGPVSSVLAGDKGALEAVLAEVSRRGVLARMIRTDAAVHCPLMAPLEARIRQELEGLRPEKAQVPMLSSLRAAWCEGSDFSVDYWARSLQEPVLFAQTVAVPARESNSLFVEVSPHPILVRDIQRTLELHGRWGPVLPSLRRGEDGRAVLLDALALLYKHGRELRWNGSSGEPEGAVLVPLSAREPESLRTFAADVLARVREQPRLSVKDLGFSAALKRSHHSQRLLLPTGSREELVRQLESFLADRAPRSAPQGGQGRRVFVFSGQGLQWAGMGRQLLAREPVFRAVLERCAELLHPYMGRSLLDELAAEGSASRLKETAVAQPALFSLQVALAALWRSWGVEPDVIVGHSVGEVAAAHVSGALTLEDAVRVVYHRGRLMQQSEGSGRMAAVALPLEEAEALVAPYAGRLAVAVSNSPISSVLSGEPAALEELVSKLEERQVVCRFLPVNYAFHSPQMEPYKAELVRTLEGIASRVPTVPLFSTVTGSRVLTAAVGAGYWGDNVRQPVRFATAVQALLDEGFDTFIEIGPHPALCQPVQECAQQRRRPALAVPSLRRGRDEWASLAGSLGELYAAGFVPDWTKFYPDGGHFQALPHHPWQRSRYWLELGERTLRAPVASARKASSSEEPSPDWRYEANWEPKELEPSTEPGGDSRKGSWLVLSPAKGLGTAVVKQLKARKEDAVHVDLSELHRAAPGDAAEDFRVLLEAHAQRGMKPLRGVVYIGCGAPSEETDAKDLSVKALEEAQALGPAKLVSLVQALSKGRKSESPRLWVVTRGAQPVSGEEAVADVPGIAQSPLWGLGKTLGLEHPEFWGGLIDLDPAGSEDEVDQVLEELLASDGEDQVAFRGELRHVARLARSPNETVAGTKLSFREDRSYLVTGGLGALGLELARWMVRQGARHLVLLSRRGLPERARWDGALEKGVAASVSAVRELEALGARVEVLSADVGDPLRMAEVFQAFGSALPKLGGIVHAAGVLGGGPLTGLSAAELARLLRAKVSGAWLLHRLSASLELDFFLCMSSIASLWGAGGLGPYAAGNAFLDALAHHRRALGLPCLSVNWGPWAGRGMAEELHAASQVGLKEFAPVQALKALSSLLASEQRQVALVDVDWSAFLPVQEARRERPFLRNMAALADAEEAPQEEEASGWLLLRLDDMSVETRREVLLDRLRAEAAKVLGLTDPQALPTRKGLFDMGMDSLMTVQFRKRLEAGLGRSLPTTVVFNYPTLEALTEFVAGTVLRWTEKPPAAVVPPRRPAPPAVPAKQDLTADLSLLSEAEAEALLLKELEMLSGSN
ncbi:type I polyketide synthase [Hyalangium rubrum]|uniref:Type I polyketide synthase n=1 Tax=Hyalangium rubrum TaxID=3103134 RepID=A0ABU5HKE4_9BACT|nr:type I polyketide synthase [Hyalangium sp. s54d21]MDY7232540.1 type I polyketide synthase [Hyalangium sp. s54d21]